MTFFSARDIIISPILWEENYVDILHLTGVFGRLDRSRLDLSPGLNLLYAPNESGKSTWGAFIRTMLYGLSTRERGPMADKNRYAPWNGAPLWGRMELRTGDGDYILLRETRRAAAPMGEFSCVYTGTATPVSGITGQNAGDVLHGADHRGKLSSNHDGFLLQGQPLRHLCYNR